VYGAEVHLDHPEGSGRSEAAEDYREEDGAALSREKDRTQPEVIMACKKKGGKPKRKAGKGRR
jgi:hypothetical protein